MKVLYISPDFNYACGVSKHVYLLIKHLSFYPEIKMFFITNKGDSLDRLKKLNFRNVYKFRFDRGIVNLAYFIPFVWNLYLFVKKNRIDIIHTHHRFPEFVSYCVSKLTGVKLVTTVHSMLKGLASLSFKSDKIISVSKAGYNNILENYDVDPENLSLTYNFIDITEFDAERNEYTDIINKYKSDNYNIVLFIGRDSPVKGYDVLLEAVDYLNSKNTILVLAGIFYGEKKSEINGIRILYVGSNNYMNSYYDLSTVVIIPSRNDTFPYVMLEAGIHSKPVIASNVGGISEYIVDGFNGLLVKPADSNDLVEKIDLLVGNKQLAIKLGENNRKCAEKYNNSKEYCDRLLRIYRDL